MKIEALFEAMNTPLVDDATSMLYEHPSISIRAGVVNFVPFCSVSNRVELTRELANRFPMCFQKSDLHGLYPFVGADVEGRSTV